jgi:two-component system cell cycle sensor histidine kinase/response regulator CckA
VYGIIRQSGGHILVYSERGRGTTFKIYLPSAEEKLNAAASMEPECIPARRPGHTVLLVEDDEIMRLLTKEMLEEHGYKVIEAADGKFALEAMRDNHHRIDVLLTDVVMRRVSGPELVRQLGESHPEMAVVYMSGYTGELLGEREAFQTGTRLLEKPFTRATLLNTVEAAIRQHT